MLCQPLIQKCVVRIDQTQHAAVTLNHVAKQLFGLTTKRLPQIVVKVGKQSQIGSDRIKVSQVQPLGRKIGRQRVRFYIGQHPSDLARQNLPLVQLIRFRQQ